MSDRIQPILPPALGEGEEDQLRVARTLRAILQTLMVVTLSVGLVLWGLSLVPVYSLALVVGVLLTEAGLLYLVRRGRTRWVGSLLALIMGVAFVANSFFFGGGSTFGAYVVVILITGLTIGWRAGVIFAGLGVASGLIVAWLESQGMLPPAIAPVTPLFLWAGNTGTFVLAAVLVWLTTRNSAAALERVRTHERALLESNRDLQASQEDLTARTQQLERRARYLGATAAVARDATSVLNLTDLLARVVNLISEQFGFYHTGIFLLDATGEWAELQAASSIGGQRMLERHHRLNIRGQGIVAYAISRRESRVALDTGADAVFFDNPDLPATRSEAALPLIARGQTLGALDVQSTEPQSFTPEDLVVLQTLADQVAMALSNVQLFQQTQESLAAERRTAAQLTRQTWQDILRMRQGLSVQRGGVEAEAIQDRQRPEIALARQTGRAVLDENTRTTLAAPVQVRGQIIGVIDAHKPQGAWKPEEIALIETLTEQLGVALEGARLYQDSQRRAVQEQLIGEVTSHIRESLDIETVLKTTASEIREALNLDTLVIRLATAETDEASGSA